MARKTVEVKWLKDETNKFMALSEDDWGERRLGMASLLEHALHHSGNYRGYTYLNVDDTTEPPTIPDESRRFYL